MTVSELLRKLKKHKCRFVEHGTNHDVWYSPITGKETQIPRHKSKEIPKGTLEEILKDMGLK